MIVLSGGFWYYSETSVLQTWIFTFFLILHASSFGPSQIPTRRALKYN
jgi:hypothetical protein